MCVEQVVVQLIPIALAAALSSVPITATIFVLLSERRGVIALPFLFGWVLGTAAALTLATLAAQAIPGRPRQLDSVIGTLEILVGAVLVGFGTPHPAQAPDEDGQRTAELARGHRLLRSTAGARHRPGAQPPPEGGAAVRCRGSGHHGRPAWVPPTCWSRSLVYTAIATSTVLVPTLATVFFPERMEPRLLASRDWLTAHGAAVTGVVMILVGIVVLWAGIAN